LRKIYQRIQLDERELRLLHGILADTQRMARLAGVKGSTSADAERAHDEPQQTD